MSRRLNGGSWSRFWGAKTTSSRNSFLMRYIASSLSKNRASRSGDISLSIPPAYSPARA